MKSKRELRKIAVPTTPENGRQTVIQIVNDMVIQNVFIDGILFYRLYVSKKQTCRLTFRDGTSRWSNGQIRNSRNLVSFNGPPYFGENIGNVSSV